MIFEQNDTEKSKLIEQIKDLEYALKVEHALDKIRLRVMNMVSSSELKEVIKILYGEMNNLNLGNWGANIMIFNQESRSIEIFLSQMDMPIFDRSFIFSEDHHPVIAKQWMHWENEEDMVVIHLEGKEKQDYDQYVLTQTDFRQFPQQLKKDILSLKEVYFSFAYFKYGYIVGISNTRQLSEDEFQLLSKFASALEITYTRFLDLKKAEAQAREAYIEAALERVRAASMAMHNSDELTEVSTLLFKELFGFCSEIQSSGIVLCDREVPEQWMCSYDLKMLPPIHIPKDLDQPIKNLHKAWESQQEFFVETLNKEASKKHSERMMSLPEIKAIFEKVPPSEIKGAESQTNYAASFKQGYLLAITDFPVDSLSILPRFAKVFEQTYTRFQDLLKAEAQAREAKIQLALERVRARTMAMQRSEELAETASLLFEQLNILGVETWTSGVNIWEKDEASFIGYNFTPEGGITAPYQIPSTEDNFFKTIYDAKNSREKFLVFESKGKSLARTYQYMKTLPVVQDVLFGIEKAGIQLPTSQVNHCVFFQHGFLLFITLEPQTEAQEIFKRFGKEFEQTYTRFLDLQKAEAQTREAQIQLALERVRARTMAMQQSHELQEVAELMFQQIEKLDVQIMGCGFNIWDEDKKAATAWMSGMERFQPPFKTNSSKDIFLRIYEADQKGESLFVEEQSGQALKDHYKYMASIPVFKGILDQLAKSGGTIPSFQIMHCAFFPHGYLMFITLEEASHAFDIFQRFAKVFEQTYTRFLDLKKAEAQAREAQIEAALERVRSRTMAIHSSNELREVVGEFFRQLQSLGIDIQMFVIFIFKSDDRMEWWGTEFGDEGLPQSYEIPPLAELKSHSRARNLIEIRENQTQYQVFELSGREKKSWDQILLEKTGLKKLPAHIKKGMRSLDKIFLCDAVCSHGILEVAGPVALSSEHAQILQRFTKVFEQTYTRFLDVQKAEAQAKEAKIEVALERVRAASMAMHQTGDLKNVVEVLFEQFKILDVQITMAFIGMYHLEEKYIDQWFSPLEGITEEATHLKLPTTPWEETSIKEWKTGKEITHYSVRGKEAVIQYAKEVDAMTGFGGFEKFARESGGENFESTESNHKYGTLSIVQNRKPTPEEIEIVKRFGKSFEQCYIRFLDLQKAEAQAREAQIEAALERVRSRTMAMHKSSELRDVAAVMYDQMQYIGLAKWGCSIIICHKETKEFEFWLAEETDSDLKENYFVSGVEHAVYRNIWNKWEEHSPPFTLHHIDEYKREFDEYWLFKTDFIRLPEEIKSLVLDSREVFLHYATMRFGLLNTATYESISDELLNTLDRFAKVFEQTYTRFLDLQKAEAQAREAQIEASLERLRARTMAMQNSSELSEVAIIINREFRKLGFPDLFESGYISTDETNMLQKGWLSDFEGNGMDYFQLPLKGDWVMDERYASWKNQKSLLRQVIGSKKLIEHLQFAMPSVESEQVREQVKQHFSDPTYFYHSYFEEGAICVITQQELMEEQESLIPRFTKVFKQSYTRFLDLQKAEAQAREAQIEVALERVRARTMAMHQSSELSDCATVLFKQLTELGGQLWSCGFVILNEDEKGESEYRMTNPNGEIEPPILIPNSGDPAIHNLYKSWKQGADYFVEELAGETIKSHYDNMLSLPKSGHVFQAILDANIEFPTWQQNHAAYFSHGFLLVITVEQFEEVELIKRFAKVFEQTYTRFLDLQKAEAQAREAQIEAALERVRSRTMAMHKTEDLREVVGVLYEEVSLLNLSDVGCNINIFLEAQISIQSWMAGFDGISLPDSYYMEGTGHPILKKMWDTWTAQTAPVHIYLAGNELKEYSKFILEKTDLKRIPEDFKELMLAQSKLHFTLINFKYGQLEVVNIADPPSLENLLILTRFVHVFEQTYTRFLDLKKAEEQAREAQIEVALERVRSRAMAMNKSNELVDVAILLRKEMGLLGVEELETSSIYIHNEKTMKTECWFSIQDREDEEKLISDHMTIDLEDTWVGREMLAFYNSKNLQTSIIMQGNHRKEWITYCAEKSELFSVEGFYGEVIPERTYHLYKFNNGYMGAAAPSKISDESWDLLKRATTVFSLAYTRFSDLQKAEAQTREAQIEAALERIRAASMAMHRTEELSEVISVLFKQFDVLGINPAFAHLTLFDKGDESFTLRLTDTSGKRVMAEQRISMKHIPAWTDAYNAWKNGDENMVSIIHYNPEVLPFVFDLMADLIKVMPPKSRLKVENYPEGIWTVQGHCKFGYLGMNITRPPVEEDKEIVGRFAKEFGRLYQRFLDLQNAEAQVRESEIQLALERVRARSMAMHDSSEMLEVADVLFQQIRGLGGNLWGCGVLICSLDRDEDEVWFANEKGILPPIMLPHTEDPTHNRMYNGWVEKMELYAEYKEGEELKEHYDYMLSVPSVKPLFEDILKSGISFPTWQKWHAAYFSQGYLLIITLDHYEDQGIFTRFARVFDQAYTRFLDLKKAEGQAREAQIEAAMERIRSRSLAMRTSEEIMDVIIELRRQIDELGQLDLEASVVHLYEKDNPMFESIAAVRPPGESGEIVLANVFFPVDAMKRIEDMMDFYWSDITEYTLEFDKAMAEEWQEVMLEYAPMIAERRVGFVKNRRVSDNSEFWNFSDFSEGSLLLVTHSPASDDTRTVLRKASQVFDLAYRRFRDLQKAEARAREATRQASLDRIRGEIASMRTTEDLNRITPVIWRELMTLEVPFIRCGVFIVDEETEKVEAYLSTPDGKALGVLNLPFGINSQTINTVKFWRKKQVYTEFWDAQTFVDWTKSMVALGQVKDAASYHGNAEIPEELHLHFIPFQQGMLYVGDKHSLQADKIELVKSLAESFSIAYARYEDFKNLEEAKNKIEVTLDELKAAQSQLIQSEKMASLGELTAGIAHEIQNPLNFVNNFSEVSKEMIQEMREEIQNGDLDEVEDISKDLEQNLEKIHHHGKRAESIVKGMLMHSRSSKGEKIPTDINALCDEFLRLSYHGLRAKDRSFNADFEMDFDVSIPKIEVVPQDIGRVLLNLINNAFQAIKEKPLQGLEALEGVVKVSTKNLGDKIEISVSDNGPGIPDAIKDKIFQPFFTTKPTGQGTGLGLSLAYDIIKAHGGSIEYTSSPDNGTEFMINIPLLQ